MLTMTSPQMDDSLLRDRPRLVRDLWIHLREFRPHLLDLYPPAYLLATIEDTIEIAHDLALDDVFVLRAFLQLRWDIAPGFYRQPGIAAVLHQRDVPAPARWAALAQEAHADDWVAAHRYDGPQEWRGRYWGVADDGRPVESVPGSTGQRDVRAAAAARA